MFLTGVWVSDSKITMGEQISEYTIDKKMPGFLSLLKVVPSKG